MRRPRCGRCVYYDTCPYIDTDECEFFDDIESKDQPKGYSRNEFYKDWLEYIEDREIDIE